MLLPAAPAPAAALRAAVFTPAALPDTLLRAAQLERRHGVVIVTDAGAVAGFATPQVEVVGVPGYADDAAFLEAARALLARRRPAALAALDAVDLLRCARLRDEFDLPGLRSADAQLFDDGVALKRRLATVVAVPRCDRVADARGLVSFAATTGLPVLLKPLRPCAPGAATLLANVDRLPPFDGARRVEAFVDGPAASVGGLMCDGRVLAAAVRGRAAGDATARWRDRVGALVAALPRTGPSPFHFDFVEDTSGRDPVLVEASVCVVPAAARPLLDAACGGDARRLWLVSQLGRLQAPA